MKVLQNYFNADSIRAGAVSSQAAPQSENFLGRSSNGVAFFYANET
jgi:hypothetical protein